MQPDMFLNNIVDPILIMLEKHPKVQIKVTKPSLLWTLTIAGQESSWKFRLQQSGPARGFWQFERYGGVAEVIQKTPIQLGAICDDLHIPFNTDTIFQAMAWNDTLACTMARLLLWQDPKPLPSIEDEEGGWQYYIRNWRPGAPHRDVWSICYKASYNVLPRILL